MSGGITLTASVNVRPAKKTRFPAGSYAAVLKPARDRMRQDTEQAFGLRKDPVTGRKWPQRKGQYPWPMLVKTGTLRQKALEATAAAVVNGNTLYVKLKDKVGKYQQEGTRLIAKRRFLGASPGTIAVVKRGLSKAGKSAAKRVLRGRTGKRR
jgi:phage gpG-like protein